MLALSASTNSEEAQRLKNTFQQIDQILNTELNGFAKRSHKLFCGNYIPEDKRIVCNEKYLGARIVQSGQFKNSSWILDTENCKQKNPDWGKLLTVIVYNNTLGKIDDFNLINKERGYQGFNQILVVKSGQLKRPKLKQILVLKESVGWKYILSKVTTPYVLFARDIQDLTVLANLERSVRLLQDPGIGFVSGAIRNQSGHWHNSCYQASIENYNLLLVPGYRESFCDCMLCSVVEGLFMTKQATLDKVPLNFELSTDEMFFSWFLDVQKSSLAGLHCPDLMYLTKHSPKSYQKVSRDSWQKLAKIHGFQGVVLHHAPSIKHKFKCSEVNLKCDPYKQQPEATILPWCCISNYAFMLKHLERLSKRFSFHYELDSGSALGAVKIGHYIPWDIDGDININSKAVFDLFQSGGRGTQELEKLGIKIYDRSNDCYGAKNAGFFKIFYGGIEIEMLGRPEITLHNYQELAGIPTRALVSGHWIKIHANPGDYARSRYGSGYLKHAQSWRYEGLPDSFTGYF
jgi:hypothetical protein